MRRTGANRQSTLVEIAQAVEQIIREEMPHHYSSRSWYLYKEQRERLRHLRHALFDAAELGLVTPVGRSEPFDENQRWRIADTWQPPRDARHYDQDGRGGGGRPGGPGGDNDDGQGGGGLMEALAHPVLFSLDEDDFETVIEELFSESRS